MQIAHRVDAEDVGEHGDEQNVGHQADCISFEVFQEVNWSQNEGHYVDEKHDGAS